MSLRAQSSLPSVPVVLTSGLPCDAECSAKHNRGVNEVFYESARVSMSTRAKGSGSYSGGRSGCIVA